MIQIIHISDFHLESKPLSNDKNKLVNALIKDLREKIEDYSKVIIVISGDLVDKGGYGFPSINNAFDSFNDLFLNKLHLELNIPKERFFFVPGNHDICRDKINQYADAGVKTILTSTIKIDEFIKNERDEGKNISRIKSYKEFENNYYSNLNIKRKHTFFDSNYIIEDLNIGISCLNSSWRCADDLDKGNLLIGKEQIDSSKEFIDDMDIKIAIMHHPFEYLLDVDKKSIKSLMSSTFDILLVGHTHSIDVAFTRDFYGTMLICQSNSTLSDFPEDIDFQNGYSIINFEKEKTVTIAYRKYLPNHEKFVSNTDIGNDKGIFLIEYPNTEHILQNKIIEKALETLNEIRCEDANEHLFTHGTDANAPCKINELFVEPIISNFPETHTNIEDIIYYTISDLIEEDNNFLIYGLKESGKTILLDKLLIEFTQKYTTYRRVPITFRFSEIGNHDISKKIKDFIGVSAAEYQHFINNTDVILLIDDIDFSDTNQRNLTKLSNFLHENPRCRIIATKEQILENSLPEDFLDININFNFNIAYIQNFKSSQIKSLIQKWFPVHSDDYQDRINRLIKNFQSLSLPRTPLSVTLFLWIIDKQENRPINNAILVEQVVENLLEKTNFENIYSDKFNSQNKIRLLAYIAKKMHDIGDENHSYRLSYTSLIDITAEYFKMKFDLNPRVVIEDFIKRGILSYNEESYVKFKFAFLYHYFLAIYLNIDSDFKTSVLNIDNCLNYIDELDYFSGLNTDSEELLELSQTLLISVFSDFNSDITEKYDKIDPFFDSKDSISCGLSMNKVRQKPNEQELEKIYDEQIKNIPIKKSIEKRPIGVRKPFDKTLKFAAQIFRNTEEIDDSSKRKIALNNIILSSISYLILHRDAVIQYYRDNKKNPIGLPENIDFMLYIRILPLLHQSLISEWIGTEKTKLIIGSKIEEDKLNLNISEYEKFLTIFIFTDIKGKNYRNLMKDYLKNNKFRYIKDFGVLKLILYYYMRSKDSESDKYYLNLISDIKLSLKQITNKSTFIYDLKKNRNNRKRIKD
jgi:predicted MPP superfamily phosphohydrolase